MLGGRIDLPGRSDQSDPAMPLDLAGRTIIVTGAGSGIGAATAIACGRAGMNVAASARRQERLDSVAAEIRRSGGGVEVVIGDVAEPGNAARLLDAAEKLGGQGNSGGNPGARGSRGGGSGSGLYAVFANAGFAVQAPMSEISAERLRRVFEVNFFASVDLLQQAAQRMLAHNQPGRLLMCSSCLGRMGLPFFGAYCATKAAQLMVCKAMNLELRERGIFVSSVHPIATRTNMFAAAAEESGLPPGSVQMFGKTPRMFVQDPERVADAIVKSLRRKNPPPEIWTSHIVRLAAGAMTMFPRFNDWVMRDEAARRRSV